MRRHLGGTGRTAAVGHKDQQIVEGAAFDGNTCVKTQFFQVCGRAGRAHAQTDVPGQIIDRSGQDQLVVDGAGRHAGGGALAVEPADHIVQT